MNRQKLKDENISLRNQITQLESRIADLEHQLQTDRLTGLMERFSFKDRVSAQIDSERRSDDYKGLCLLFADIDNFKAYNEIYGHEAGDKAIAAVGKCIHDLLRDTDFVGCRIGGDEFAVMLTNCTIIEAYSVAHRINLAIEMMQHEHKGNAPSYWLTISTGVAEVDRADEIENLLLRADKKMYEAKARGKNSVF